MHGAFFPTSRHVCQHRKVLFKLWPERHFFANSWQYSALVQVWMKLFPSLFSSNQDWNKMFYLPLLQRSKIGQHTGWGAAEVKGVASRRAECLLTCEFSDLSLTNIVPLDFIEGYLQAAAVKIATKLSLKSCSFQFRLRLTILTAGRGRHIVAVMMQLLLKLSMQGPSICFSIKLFCEC